MDSRKKNKPEIEQRASIAPADSLEEHNRKALAVTPPPDDLSARLVFDATMTDEIQSLFESRLTPQEHALYHSGQPWTLGMLGRLNKTIIELAQTFGYRIYRSELVQQQMEKWHNRPEDIYLIKQLGEAVHLAAQLAHGRAKLPITEPAEWREIKPRAVGELRRLFAQSRKIFNQRRTRLNYQEVCDWFRKTIESAPKAFPLMWLNIESLFQYFEHASKKDSGFAQRMALGNLRPAGLFNEWGAYVRNLSPATFRQSTSRLSASEKL